MALLIIMWLMVLLLEIVVSLDGSASGELEDIPDILTALPLTVCISRERKYRSSLFISGWPIQLLNGSHKYLVQRILVSMNYKQREPLHLHVLNNFSAPLGLLAGRYHYKSAICKCMYFSILCIFISKDIRIAILQLPKHPSNFLLPFLQNEKKKFYIHVILQEMVKFIMIAIYTTNQLTNFFLFFVLHNVWQHC